MPRRAQPFAVLAAVVVAVLAASAAHAAAPGEPQIAILCYHDVSADSTAPRFTVSPELLRRQLRACRRAGWTFVPLSELLAKRDRPWELPKRTMVLTFDDGYRSFADRALPVLRAERARATLAIVSAFIDQPPPGIPPVLDWDAIAALDRAGDAEVISHSHDLHRWIPSNPQGDTAPALATRRWLGPGTRYENREEYRSRIHADLTAAQRVMTARLGHPVPVLAWPYGMDNEMAHGIAAQAGFRVTLTLGARLVTRDDLRAGRLPRFMVTREMRFDNDHWLTPVVPTVRAAGIDLDGIYDPDDAVFRARIDRVVARARTVGATHAIVDACSDSAGHVLGAWFPGHQVATRADVWAMVAAKLAHAGLRVWIRAPVMNLTWAAAARPDWRLPAAAPDASAWPDRLSPELVEARRAAVDFFTDLAVYLPIDGVLFDGDARVGAGERLAGAAAGDPAAQAVAIRQLVDECKAAVRAWRPECRFGRTLDATAAAAPGIDPASSQDLDQVFVDGDLAVVPVAPAGLAGADANAARRAARRSGDDLARRLARRWKEFRRRPGTAAATTVGVPSPPPVLLELRAVDRREGWLPPRSLATTIAGARRAGIASFGVHPVLPAGPALDARLLDGQRLGPPVEAYGAR